jgi:hypothetical protein
MNWPDDFKSRRAVRKPRQVEHYEQCALFQWVDMNRERHPDLQQLFAIPNGGHRHIAVGVSLKAEGVMPGVFDLFLPLARGRHFGIWLELKQANGRLSDAQKEFKAMVEKNGYCASVCHGWESAASELVRYLALGEFRA